jgi:GMP synthase (glutamine-hydrolysing)
LTGYIRRRKLKKLLIIKTGSTYEEIFDKHGDFEDHIIKQAGLIKKDVIISEVFKNENLPPLKNVCGIIITGSHAMVTDREAWSLYTSIWLTNAVRENIPILGICYGHQLLAEVFGGTVNYHPQGEEHGTVKIELTNEGKKDPLFGVLPNHFLGHVTHAQTIITPPQNTKVLAKNDFDGFQAVSFAENIWGVQFHPEFNKDIMKLYIDLDRDTFIKKNYDVDAIYNSIEENPFGEIILKRFIEIVGK